MSSPRSPRWTTPSPPVDAGRRGTIGAVTSPAPAAAPAPSRLPGVVACLVALGTVQTVLISTGRTLLPLPRRHADTADAVEPS